MSETKESESSANSESTPQVNKKDKVRKVTNYLLLFVAAMLIFSVISDRVIPITDNARVKGYIVPIKPEVSGKVLDIRVQPNQLVEQGDVLAVLDDSDYRIAVAQAEQNLEIAGQNRCSNRQYRFCAGQTDFCDCRKTEHRSTSETRTGNGRQRRGVKV